MISLSEAFKLCKIGEEPVYLRENGKSDWSDRYFWSTKIREKFDMQKIQVVRIEPEFERYGHDFLGMCFVVTGITDQDLVKKGGM